MSTGISGALEEFAGEDGEQRHTEAAVTSRAAATAASARPLNESGVPEFSLTRGLAR